MSDYTYKPLSIESFSEALRANSPPYVDMKGWRNDSIIEWAENNPEYATYFKSHINNPDPYTPDGFPEPFHNPELKPGEVMPNPVYIQDYKEYKASKDPDHLKYLGFNVEQMAITGMSGLAFNMGWLTDPEAQAQFRTDALEWLSDKTKWMPLQAIYVKGAQAINHLLALDKESPEYKEAKKSADEYYAIAEGYMQTGLDLAQERIAKDEVLRGYFRWMENEPMSLNNLFHEDQFKRSMVEFAPSIAAMASGTALAGPAGGIASLLQLENSAIINEALQLMTVEGLPVKDEYGNLVMEPEFINIEGKAQKNPKFGEPIRETMTIEEASPYIGPIAIAYAGISGGAEAFQIGRATRLLNIAPQARKSFVAKMANKFITKQPGLAKAALYPVDIGIEAIEGGAIEWFQNVVQMATIAAMEEGYGSTPSEAIGNFADKVLGPVEMPKFMLSKEGGMSPEAKEAFLLGLSGEFGMGMIGAPGRIAYQKFVEGKDIPTWFSYQAGTTPEDAPFDMGEDIVDAEMETELTGTTQGSDQVINNVVNAPDRNSAALSYVEALIGQVSKGPLLGAPINNMIFKAGGTNDEGINQLIKRGANKTLETLPGQKAYDLIQGLNNDPTTKAQVIEAIKKSPELSSGVASIEKNALSNQLADKDKGTSTNPSQAEDAIMDIDDADLLDAMASEKLDMVQELANEKLQAEELEARIEKAQQEEADKQYDEPILDDDLEDLAAAKAMGLKGTDAEILKKYRKELESEPAPKKKVDINANVNKMDSPGKHLQDVQNQSGDLYVKNILNATGKKRINNTTLNKIQKEVLSKEEQMPASKIATNRNSLIKKVQSRLLTKSTLAPHRRKVPIKTKKAPVKKVPVKKVAKKKTIPTKEIVPPTGEITVYRDNKKSTVKVEKTTDNVTNAINFKRELEILEDVETGPTKAEKAAIDEYQSADTLIVQGDQSGLIKQMQQLNVPGADKIPITAAGKVDYSKADPFIRDFFKDNFKYIRYNNKQLPKKGVEFHDLTKDKFYGTEPKIAKEYDRQRKARDKKKQPIIEATEEDIAAAKAAGMPIADYMKALNEGQPEEKAPAKKKERKPTATEVNEKALEGIIGKPEISRKAQKTLSKAEKEAANKQEQKNNNIEELDSSSNEISNKLDEDLCL